MTHDARRKSAEAALKFVWGGIFFEDAGGQWLGFAFVSFRMNTRFLNFLFRRLCVLLLGAFFWLNSNFSGYG